MRIQQLNLAAFGPFSDRILDFDEPGLHIVYGPNEAGKSSALRGLKALLYGVDERTSDNFVHANDKLRVNGWLHTADGQELCFVRRKGRKNTLLTPAGEVLDEQALTPFLRGVTSQLFETLFGIDHRALVQGGEEILEQKGEVGQALFSAALGSHALHAVLAQLDSEADALFRPMGSKQAINSSLKAYAELNKAVRECSLSSREWEAQRRALERTTKALEAIQSELAGKRIEVNRLQRIQRVLPKLARRRELLQELASLGDVVILSADFAERRQKTVNGLETAQAIVGKSAPRLEELQKQLQGLSINQALLDQAETIEDLHARLGGYRKALQDRPHLETQANQRLTDADSILKEIRPDLKLKEIEQLRFVLARHQAISESGNKKALLVSALKQAESNLFKIENRLQSVRRERADITESGAPEALYRAVAAARKEGDLDRSIQSAQRELSGLKAVCNDGLSRLTLWKGELEDLAGLGLPKRESINRFEAAYDELRAHFQRLEKERERTASSLQQTLLRLDEIQRAGQVPTEADLIDARSGRDRLWQLLRRHWIGGEDVSAEVSHYQDEGALPDAFENRLADTDELSDRLRREADRVAEMATLQAGEAAALRLTEELTGQLVICADKREELDSDWKSQWASSGIAPHSPREMRAWLDDFEKLRDRAAQLNALQRRVAELGEIRKTHIEILNRQLVVLGMRDSAADEMESVLLECEAVARHLEEIRRRRELLDEEIKQREADVASLVEAHRLATLSFAAWTQQWGESMQSFGLPIEASPSEVNDYIGKVREMFAIQGEVEKLRMRIKAINQDAALFRSQVADMAAAIAPELADLPADDAAVRINSLLSENRSRETKRQQIEVQVEQAAQEIQESNASIQTLNDRLHSLCVEAKCESSNELEEAERRSTHYLIIRETVDLIEREVLETGEGATVADLEAESGRIDPDALPASIAELRDRIEDDLEPKRTRLAETKGGEETLLALMDGSDQAAVLAEQAQAKLAAIRSDAERYVQVKLAGRILRDQIERYRKQNQGPLVKRAGEHFAALTLGSFEDLMTDFNERDEPVLAGVRPNGEKVYVAGMSSGTRDQLYLSLRLASLEKYMESSEPMPFIVDDVLVDFDDQRSLAALKGLAALAEKSQVILFTHHAQLVEQAQQLPGPLQVHRLALTE